METIYFPVAISIHFLHLNRHETRRFSAHSLHSFKVEKRLSSAILTAPDGAIAYGVYYDSFERLPTGYVWAKFKERRVLATAKRRSGESWNWQPGTVTFEAGGFYAIKILPPDAGQTDSCNFQTKDRKIFPYVDRRYFSVVSENFKTTLPRVLEAFPLPVPGVPSDCITGFWNAPTEHDGIPVILDKFLADSFTHPTLKPVAALRLDFDMAKCPVYRCGYFGPAPK